MSFELETRKLVDGLLSANGKSFKLVSCSIKDTFSMAGSKRAIAGTKANITIEVAGKLTNIDVVLPRIGNGLQAIFHGVSLTNDEKLVVDSFYESELWALVLERNPGLGLVAFQVDLSQDKAGITIGVKTKKGYETTVRGVLTRASTITLARDLGLGVGYTFNEAVVNSVRDKAAVLDAADKQLQAAAA
jgi:hypothetical protein